MTDTLAPTVPPIGEPLTLETAALARAGDLVSIWLRGQTYFGPINEIVRGPGSTQVIYISGAGVSGPPDGFTFVGRPGRNGWLKFNGDVNPAGDVVIEARLATGAVMRKRACDFPDVAWKAVITHIRPYTAPPTPTTETVEKAIRALTVFAKVVDSYAPQEDDSFEIWMDRGVPGAPGKEVFQLKAYREAKAALDLLKGPRLLERDAGGSL